MSSANSEFNTDLGFSSSQEQTREWAAPMLDQLLPIAARNARETGTDIVGYLTESFGFSVFVLDDGAVYQTYSAGYRARGRLPPGGSAPAGVLVVGELAGIHALGVLARSGQQQAV